MLEKYSKKLYLAIAEIGEENSVKNDCYHLKKIWYSNF